MKEYRVVAVGMKVEIDFKADYPLSVAKKVYMHLCAYVCLMFFLDFRSHVASYTGDKWSNK